MGAALAECVTTENLRQLDELAKEDNKGSIDELLDAYLRRDHKVAAEDRQLADELRRDDKGDKPNRDSFWYDEDDPETNTEEHDEFDEDDITSMAHGKLDEIREMRHYMRLAVWEMPLLSKLAKPFVPPSDDQVLRWRYTTYMGESHPAEKKVVVQFAPDDLKLTPAQTHKLKLLAGARYDPETELVKMSCESFEHQAQNKRYLMDLVAKLVAAAKDPADTFADVPLDTRHRPAKERPRFPREWRVSEQRRRELADVREQAVLADAQRQEQGRLVDGKKVVEEYLLKKYAEEQEKLQVPELVAAPRPARSGAGRKLRR
ncbi:hypothetical protein HIM_02263 [Hirsutella minnesotensis 3608]|nr:hypothetical protein HIM_02263 [Hirsutella minnesotensis 3608]